MRNDKKNYVMFVLFRNGQTYEESFRTKNELERRIVNYLCFAKNTKCFNNIIKIELMENGMTYKEIKGGAV